MAESPTNSMDPPAFRAPPPSPAAGHHVLFSETPDEDDFSGFLNRSRLIPELILPNRILHLETAPWYPPEIDMRSLTYPDGGAVGEILRSAAESLGCLQLVNHGIVAELVEAAIAEAAEVFRIPAERKREAARSPERRWGFESEDEENLAASDEFFWWSGEGGAELAGILPDDGFFRMKKLVKKMKKLARKIELVLMEKCNSSQTIVPRPSHTWFICVRRHGRTKATQSRTHGDPTHMVLGALIRSLACSHALGLHLPLGASIFRAYSKRAPAAFCPRDDAIMITIGDQMHTWSGGAYRNVTGKPEYADGGGRQDPISLAFLHSFEEVIEPSTCHAGPPREERKSISIGHQIIVYACLLLLYRIIAYACF
ncbi:hypothetical protein HPP92_006042 [Vanilla planifolia]|uniref:Non-haem dioxygenase N-terminal domain-containing protein n=1 Tax=Vanilla planifolia TaxID=51239 RepID=A0A835RLY7_VANPL|nr:hypothetical protein HPP92_006371 [Vanilla planifolia]KAG0495048.1 hypothetical protein HPP92_006042 [Vanilla planifolia]